MSGLDSVASRRVALRRALFALFEALPDWLYRVFKLEPWLYHGNRERWERRTYPCCRWWCFRRSPAWRSFSRGGKSYCDRHVPGPVISDLVTDALYGEAFSARMFSDKPGLHPDAVKAYRWAELQFLRIAKRKVDERDLIG